MKLHLPNLLRAAVLACLAAFPAANATTLVANGVNPDNITSSTRFFDNGKGYYWQAMGEQPWRGAGQLFNQFGNFSFMGELRPRLGGTTMSLETFAPLLDDENTCWYNVSANVLSYWESYYGVFADSSRPPVYGYTYDKQYLDDLAGTQSLRKDMLFYDTWTNGGGDFYMMAPWYMVDDHTYTQLGGDASVLRNDSTKGGYFSKWFHNDPASTLTEYFVEAGQLANLKEAADAMIEAFGAVDNGDGTYSHTAEGQIAFIGIVSPDGAGHAMTAYGFETNDDGTLKSILFANSDDREFCTFSLYTKMEDDLIFLYEDENLTTLWDFAGLNWFLEEVSYIPTPEELKKVAQQYNHGQLTWSGTTGAWKSTAAADPDVALPTADGGWVIPVNDTTYAAAFTPDRSVRFDDVAAGSAFGGTVTLAEGIAVPSMTIANTVESYLFDGGGDHGLRAEELVKEGTGSAVFTNISLFSPQLKVKAGELILGADTMLGGDSTVTVEGGTLAFDGGYADITGSITATAGEVAVRRTSQVQAPAITIGENAALSLYVTPGQLATPLMNAAGSAVTINGLVKVDFEDWNARTIVIGQPYLLVSAGTLSVGNQESLLVSSSSIPDIAEYDAVLDVQGNALNLIFTRGNARYWAGGTTGTWNRAEDNIVWAEERGGIPTSHYDSDYYAAHFDGGAGVTTITVGEDIKLTEWNVSGGEYHFTGADKVSPSKRIVVENGGTMVVDKAPQLTSAPLIVGEGSSFTMTDDATLTVWTLENKGTVDIAKGNLALRSATTRGGDVNVAKDLTLAAASDNIFDELHVGGTVTYSGEAGILRVGAGSAINTVSGGTLLMRDAEGTVELTTEGTSTLAGIMGPGALDVAGSLHLTGTTNYDSTLTVADTLRLDSATTIANLTAGYIKPEEGAILTVTETLDCPQLEVSSITSFDAPQYRAGSLASDAMEFRLTVNALESVKAFGFLSGDTISLLRNIGAAPSRVPTLTLTGGASYLELDDGMDHVARIAQNDKGDVVLHISVIDILQWVSEDGVWSSFRDWDPNGTEFTEPNPATPIGFLGGGTAVVDINGDRTVKSILLEAVDKNYTLAGEGTLATQKIDVRGGSHTFGDGVRDLLVKVDGTVAIGTRGSLTVSDNTKLTADEITISGSSVGVYNDGRIDVRNIDASGAKIVNSGKISLDTATVGFIIGRTQSQAGDVTVRSGGQLNLAKDSRIGYLDNGGTVNIATSASLTLLQETTLGGNVSAGTLNLAGGTNSFNHLVAISVNGNSGSLYMGDSSNIKNLNGGGSLHLTGGEAQVDNPGYDLQNLTIAQDALLRFGATDSPLVPAGFFKGIADVLPQEYLWTEVHGTFSSGGSLVSNRTLIFDKKVANGGNLTAPAVALASSGNVFGDLVTDSITFTSAPTDSAPLVYVNRLANYSEDAGTITLNLLEAPLGEGIYELIDGCGSTAADGCTLSPDALAQLRREHLNGELGTRDDDLWLYVTDMGRNHYPEITGGNAKEGARMASQAYFELSPQLNRAEYPDLARALDGLDTHLARGNRGAADTLAAAIAGASIPALSEALRSDVERQLRAIRNRTTTMGINSCCADPKDLPYVNAWINAEGDYRRLEHDKTLSGFKYSSWGGTVGVDVDVTSSTTAGLAFTAMFGDFKSDAADHLDGDLNNFYLTAFARHASGAWVHGFIATLGRADAKVDRTVATPFGGYSTKGSTSGSSFGLMYEVARTYALTEDSSTCIQPIVNISYIHTSLGGYSESGSDAALKVEDIDSNLVTIGAGARVQTAFGADVYNRTSVFEGRALVKGYLGDRDSTAKVQFTSLGSLGGASVKSAERGPIGIELGGGIYIPLGQNAGTIFLDASLELRAKDMDINTTAGYRINF